MPTAIKGRFSCADGAAESSFFAFSASSFNRPIAAGSRDKPEKMNENEEANLRQAKTQLEESANHLMVLYTSEQETDGTNNAL